MTELQELKAEIEALTTRVKALEDHLEIAQLTMRYGPYADSGDAAGMASLWTEDGVYDVAGGGAHFRSQGPEALMTVITGDGHQEGMRMGQGHVLSIPHIVVDGDRATGRGYAFNVRYDHQAKRHFIFRLSANRWEWTRTDKGWRVVNRTNRALDGGLEAQEIMHER